MKLTDQIYYKIQYPLKKAIEIIKKVDEDSVSEYTAEDIETLKAFLETWEQDGKKSLQKLIKELKEYNKAE